MKTYIDIVKKVLNEGKWKSPVRMDQDGVAHPVDGGVRTLACMNVLFSHNMKDGFPLLTTKKMAHKAMRVELEGFIKGITSKKWFNERGCKIWQEWANQKAVDKRVIQWQEEHARDFFTGKEMVLASLPHRKQFQLEENDLGPIYGFQWRRFGETYDEDDDGVIKGSDQLKRIVDTLHTNYNDRRMVCSAWNPNQLSRMGLPACHTHWYIGALEDKLNLFWSQRSCDLMYGVPFNIASYGLLLTLLSKEAGLKPGNLSGMLFDCHIYENQIESAKLQIEREPRPLPTVTINNTSEDKFNIFDWTHDNFELTNYDPHPKLSFGDVVV